MYYPFGTGAIKDKKDKRDYQFSKIALALAPFDWNLGYDIEQVIGKKLPVKDQNGSGSCGGQAWSYYGQVLDKDLDEKSAKFIYSQTFVKPAGSAGRTNCDLVIKKGWGTEALTSSYDGGMPPGEAFMQRPEDITSEAFTQALNDKALSYANVIANIDSIALAIRENKGCIIGITGQNNGTWSTKFPLPPTQGEWNHWVYCGKAVLINGKKYIGFINSWGSNVGDQGWQYISEDYIKAKWIFSVWTLVYNFPKFIFTKTLRLWNINSDVKELQKRLGIFADGIFGPMTRSAVIKYQKSKGLVPDGICGPKTLAVLNQ